MLPGDGDKETKRGDLLKARKFHSFMADGLIPDAIQEEYTTIKSNKVEVGYPFQKNMAELIEGIAERGDNEYLLCKPKSAYCHNHVSKQHKKPCLGRSQHEVRE